MPVSYTVQRRATLEDLLLSTRIYAGQMATLNGERRDEPQHIARLLQRGEPPVGAMATVAH